MSVDPVIRELANALSKSHVASSPGLSAVLAKAVARSSEVERVSTAESLAFFKQLQAYLRSLELANMSKDSFGSCSAWYNLSALYVDAGLYSESIACGARCIQIAASSEPPIIDMAQRANNNIALAKFRLADYEGALAAARKSVHGLP